MREIRDSGKVVGLDRIAVMAALNITHDLLTNKNQKDDINQSISSRVKNIQEKIESALHNGKQMEL
jgi:cell division protein ZapA